MWSACDRLHHRPTAAPAFRIPFFYNRGGMTITTIITGADSSFNPTPQSPIGRSEPLTWADKRLTALFWSYRLSSYLLLNLVEDPAWLALIFC